MKKLTLVTGYLFGVALALVGQTPAAIAEATEPTGNGKIAFVTSGADERLLRLKRCRLPPLQFANAVCSSVSGPETRETKFA